ncbi:ImmA/IrrE family metallo-endopeptidase [Rhodococcus hoagii]|nr:ImmA/IrrE family metallo-endopeptidase [Prescottella equi]
MSAPTYDPWFDLETRTDLHVGVRPLRSADVFWLPDQGVILLGSHLSETERTEHLAHALVHVDLGHRPIPQHRPGRDRFMADRERATEIVSAERLIGVDAMNAALRESDTAEQAADALGVTPGLLRLRHRRLSAAVRYAFGLCGAIVDWTGVDDLPPYACGVLNLGSMVKAHTVERVRPRHLELDAA